MKFSFLSILMTFCLVWTVQAQELAPEQLASQLVQIIRANEDEFRQEAMQEFDKMDVDFDGYVSEREFGEASGYGTSEQRIAAFRGMDGNHDGALTKDEMWSFVLYKINTF